jgi:aminoglycoside 6-adenylyltransferase
MTASQSAGDLLPELTRWAAAHDLVRAVLLTSTRAVPGAPVDVLSDYDVILIVRELAPWVTDHSWLDAFGEVLVVYWDPVQPDPATGIEQCGNVTQYAGGLKIDCTLGPVTLFRRIATADALPAELDAGYRVLLDKDGLAAGLRPPTGAAYIPSPPTLDEYLTHINDFLSDAPYVAKCLWRGDLLPAKWCLDYDMKHVYLRQMLEWRAETEHGWAVPVGFLGKGLKKRLPPEIWMELEQTFAGAGLEDNWEALERTLALFRRVGIEVGARLGYRYPDELHARVRAYVERIRRLPVAEG